MGPEVHREGRLSGPDLVPKELIAYTEVYSDVLGFPLAGPALPLRQNEETPYENFALTHIQ
jgi:hypothetical protein